MQTRTLNTINNIFAGFLNKLVSVTMPFIIRTIIIYRLGADYVGINSLFTSILQVLNATELGFSAAIIYCLYKPIADDDIPEIRRYMSLYKSIYKIVGAVILATGICILPFIGKFINGDYPHEINIYIVFFIYLTDTVISYLTYGYKNAVIIASQKNSIISNVNSVVCLARSVVQVAVLLLFESYYAYLIAFPLLTLIFNIYTSRIADKLFPEVCRDLPYSLNGINEIKKQVAGLAIGRVSLMCRNSLDSIIVSAYFSLTLTAVYSNYYSIFMGISNLLTIILVSMSASVGNSLVTDSMEKNEQDHIKFDYYYMMLAAFFCMCSSCIYQPFMRLWLGKDLMLPFSSMILFCIYFYVNQLSQIRSVYSEAGGLWWYFRYWTVGEMLANLVLNIFLGKYFGVNGILIATIITAFFSSFVGLSVITYKRLFKKSPMDYFYKNMLYFFQMILGMLMMQYLFNGDSICEWIGLISYAVCCVMAAGFYLLCTSCLFGFMREHLLMLWRMRVCSRLFH